jgi:putative peptide zinc metalloprotease protein
MVRHIDPHSLTLPPLREEVHCLQGPTQFDGSPSWTLHDPANNRFFRIGWAEFEMLARWQLGNHEQIAEHITSETTLKIDSSVVDHFVQFLLSNNLLALSGEQAIQRLRQQVQARKQTLAMQLLHHYLFFKIPLFKPDRLLGWLYPKIAWIYSRWVLGAIILLALVGLYFVSRQWEQFLNTFPHFFNWQGLSLYFVSLIFSKVLHELGHALTAHRYGCRVPTMGVAFMVMYPMLYTDANEIWKLNSRPQRLAIASAGVITELVLAVFATLAWSFMADGPVRSGAFLLATTTWIMTLAVNLSPFMRFDGYYLLADLLKIENLQPRAFAYNIWLLRRVLFRLDTPPPEIVPRRISQFFAFYAWGVWLYRLFLFLGIAWMVYHYFFKLLGVFLMFVEIGWFIIKPIWTELKVWPALNINRENNLRLAVMPVLLLLILFLPWQQHLELPAQIKPAHYAEIYLPYPAKLTRLIGKSGQTIESGDLLAELVSNELLYQSKNASHEAELLAWQVSFQGLDANLIKERQIRLQQWESASSKQEGIHHQLEQLHIQSPITGKVFNINDQISAGQWLKSGEELMIVADTSSYIVEAFVSEDDIMKIVNNATALFYPDNIDSPPMVCHLTVVDNGSTQYLPAIMSSNYNGPIAARLDLEKKNIPETAQYRVVFNVNHNVETKEILPFVLRGTIKVDAQSNSIAERFLKQSLNFGIRESGF